MIADPFEIDISRRIWESRYRYQQAGEAVDLTPVDSWLRLARSLATCESRDPGVWQRRFLAALRDFRFLPGGRVLAGAGTGLDVTLFNCFVMGTIDDSMAGICDSLKEGALTMQQGGGVGYDFSTLRPAGSYANRVGSMASGPVSFMRVWDSMCATLVSSAYRRGAMMATLRCDHPDIETFIDAKRDSQQLRNFNLSVLVSDDFMQAVADDGLWSLVFPVGSEFPRVTEDDAEMVECCWTGMNEPVPCKLWRRIPARKLWQRIMRANYDMAEPGVLFIDRINRLNNLNYLERISATNPCGEIPLPPYGACNLGSVNLTAFVRHPFAPDAAIDFTALEDTVRVATRMLNHVIDLSGFPLPAQAEQARGSRRIGLGMTGLADTLIMLGLHYAQPAARKFAAKVMRRIRDAAYRESVELAKIHGAFPFFDRDAYSGSEFIANLPDDIRQDIFDHGIRNSHCTAIAPAGTISLFANNVSSGIEPVFDYEYERRIRGINGEYTSYVASDYAWRRWQSINPGRDMPDYFVNAHQLDPRDHIAMQAALQPFVDSAISKTINVPAGYDFSTFQDLYFDAYRRGLKGCTTFRPNEVTGVLLGNGAGQMAIDPDSGCCNLERESG